jgi:hypothetical protein
VVLVSSNAPATSDLFIFSKLIFRVVVTGNGKRLVRSNLVENSLPNQKEYFFEFFHVFFSKK